MSTHTTEVTSTTAAPISDQLMLVELEADALWMDEALCAQTDPEAFFPEKGGSTRAAKAVCATCPVCQDCLDYALAHREPSGIWGGLSARERRDLLKATGAALVDDAEDTESATHDQNGTAA